MKYKKKIEISFFPGIVLFLLLSGCTVSPPVLSPSQDGVYFVNPAAQKHRLFYLPLKTAAEPELLWMDEHINAITPSPDGKSIFYITLHEESKDIDRLLRRASIHQYDKKDKTSRIIGSFRIDDKAVFALNLSVSPAGDKIFFSGEFDGKYQIAALNIKSGRIKTVIPSNEYQIFPVISPDGKNLLYYSSAKKKSNRYQCKIYIFETKCVHTLLNGDNIIDFDRFNKDQPYFDVLKPAFSPSGTSVAFVKARAWRDRGFNNNRRASIITYNLLNHSIRNITPPDEINISPVWIGEHKLVFVRWTDERTDLKIFDRENISYLLPGSFRSGADRMPVYSDKHHMVVYRSGKDGPGIITFFNVQINDIFRYPVTVEAIAKLSPKKGSLLYERMHAATSFNKAIAYMDKNKNRRAMKILKKIVRNDSSGTFKKISSELLDKIKSRRGTL